MKSSTVRVLICPRCNGHIGATTSAVVAAAVAAGEFIHSGCAPTHPVMITPGTIPSPDVAPIVVDDFATAVTVQSSAMGGEFVMVTRGDNPAEQVLRAALDLSSVPSASAGPTFYLETLPRTRALLDTLQREADLDHAAFLSNNHYVGAVPPSADQLRCKAIRAAIEADELELSRIHPVPDVKPPPGWEWAGEWQYNEGCADFGPDGRGEWFITGPLCSPIRRVGGEI